MPFKSNKQREFLFANKPKVAQTFAHDEKPVALASPVTPAKPIGDLAALLAKGKGLLK